MHIKILGTGCAKCNSLERKVRDIVAQYNIDAIITKVSDIEQISRYGIIMTPALVIDEVVVSIGSVPSDKQLLSMLKGEK
ncbi:MAG TPA: thioredoxin family protein [Candidatus Kapabacteria bacterium]|jgi:small redox-active disulfide protein 2|nr:thioredoxin family protein [Candidatus Kapabacteria bacterium]HOM06048.1 thioredoxin family protein [Candidatus Kapabacteria bacterium]HOQ48565.1 thioredoxin family protein [Candidatus Kapabacteria bacterium]HPP40583.1 thioredoxin family protein [Candidatus Kapabacteria bacterium]HPU23983.1 thioredoxin family protein [Candidatus Kapabacteria bacterium]